MIAANSELRERELLEQARLDSAMANALRARGVDDMTARLAAETGVLAFATAFARWTKPGNREPYTEIVYVVLHDLQTRATTLGVEVT